MAGAWEGNPDPIMMIAIPNQDLVTMHWSLEFGAMWKPNGCLLRGWSGMPLDIMRNIFVKNARENKAKYILFMDSDVLPVKPDWIKLLMDAQQPIISGLYWSKKGNPGIWVKTPGEKHDVQTYQPVPQFPRGSIIEIDAVGAGALLIETRVFAAIDKALGPLCYPRHPDLSRYFGWEFFDPDNVLPGEKSEDFSFCDLAQRAGFSILCHTGVELFHEQTIAWNIDGVVSTVQN